MIIDAPFTIITGASQGFGKSLALECASRGMNLILVSLPGSGLIELSDYIKSNFSISVIQFEMDLCDDNNYQELHNSILKNDIPVRYLINNAGMLSHGYFEDMDLSYCQKLIQLNTIAPTLLTKLFLPILKKNSPSVILNVASLTSFFYLPCKQVYGGTKSYLISFSRSLRRELISQGIKVSTVCPGGLNSNTRITYQNRTGSLFSQASILNTEVAAKLTIQGMLKGKELIIPGKLNRFFLLLNKILPDPIIRFITRTQMAKFKGSYAYV